MPVHKRAGAGKSGQVLRVGWYRSRATFRRRLAGYLTRAPVVSRGRADTSRLAEVVARPGAAALLRLRVGSCVRVGLISSAQKSAGIPDNRRVDLAVAGIGVFHTQALQDAIDSSRTGFL